MSRGVVLKSKHFLNRMFQSNMVFSIISVGGVLRLRVAPLNEFTGGSRVPLGCSLTPATRCSSEGASFEN